MKSLIMFVLQNEPLTMPSITDGSLKLWMLEHEYQQVVAYQQVIPNLQHKSPFSAQNDLD